RGRRPADGGSGGGEDPPSRRGRRAAFPPRLGDAPRKAEEPRDRRESSARARQSRWFDPREYRSRGARVRVRQRPTGERGPRANPPDWRGRCPQTTRGATPMSDISAKETSAGHGAHAAAADLPRDPTLLKGKISYAPTEGLSYDPAEPKYWDARGLAREVHRVFEVCNGCRM